MIIELVAGISWEPEIRGALVAAVGTTVLMGSVWLILATNVGHRLATLLSFAGFFSWMAIMGVVWGIYGIGLRGDTPSWDLVSVSDGPADTIATAGDVANARFLRAVDPEVTAPGLIDRYCPGLVDATADLQFRLADGGNPETTVIDLPDGLPSYCTDEVGETVAVSEEAIALRLTEANNSLVSGNNPSPLGEDDPRYMQPDELEETIAVAIDDERRKRSQLTLSSLAAGAQPLIDEAIEDGLLDFGGWTLINSAAAGEAQASADVFLTELGESNGGFDASTDFIALNTYKIGGKPEKNSFGDRGTSQLGKAWNEFRNTVKFWHPDQFIAVEVVGTIDKEAIEGQAPPFAEIDASQESRLVIMQRNRGSLRYPSIRIAIASFVIFAMLALMLHRRDLRWRQARDAWDPASAGAS